MRPSCGGYFWKVRGCDLARSPGCVGRAQSYADMFHALACVVLAYSPAPRFSPTFRTAPLMMAEQHPDAALFENLIEMGNARSAVTLRRSDLGRSLVASKDVEAGDLLLSIPMKLTLTCHRSGVVGGLVGQTDLVEEAAGDLRAEVGEEMFNFGATWDVRLAVAVLEATAGAGGPFWDRPPPSRLYEAFTSSRPDVAIIVHYYGRIP